MSDRKPSTVSDSEPVTIEVANTVHGPVVEWDLKANRAYSKKWAVWMKEGIGWSAYFDIARAKNLEDFNAVLQRYMLNGNYSYGDAQRSYTVLAPEYLAGTGRRH